LHPKIRNGVIIFWSVLGRVNPLSSASIEIFNKNTPRLWGVFGSSESDGVRDFGTENEHVNFVNVI